ncbi:5-hydroxyisourate hydrolase [Tritonibacter horizontis]|uniref:5-hydroxyisourate hydrolase n=2 Tax=Tritonibacter horizontis TaxID=1768241 RepID=A0A132BYY0_9RHOB|nr:5-hydroxyisourate hydrolase [Tritonibacter horizontis]
MDLDLTAKERIEMTGYLTTHVLDTARGCPAEGIRIALYRVSGNSHRKIAEAVTNADGRTDSPILPAKSFKTGTYELIFFTGDYLRASGQAEDPLFLDAIPIRFGISEGESHYHVPLLVSPFGYSTYRGS